MLTGEPEPTFDFPSAPVDELGAIDASRAPDASPTDGGGVVACTSYATGALLEATADVNLRAGAATSERVIEVVPTGSVVSVTTAGCPVNGFLPVTHHGVRGWSYASYYRAYTAPQSDAGAPGTFTRADAIARARQSVGFAYWWGHGRWRPEGISAATRGTCTGNCPGCTFTGSYGADCSGMVAKAWRVPSSNDDVAVDRHPFGTVHFVDSNALWSDVSRANLRGADALVYNTNGAGHILLYESGDGWGSVYAYECKGCSYGCVHNLRSVGSAYKGIRRAGF